jgi:hypothetical protein
MKRGQEERREQREVRGEGEDLQEVVFISNGKIYHVLNSHHCVQWGAVQLWWL